MVASDNDIQVLSDTISSIKILDENENPQKDDDIIVFSGKYLFKYKNTQRRLSSEFDVDHPSIYRFFVLYEKFKKTEILVAMKGAGYAPFEKGDKYQRADQRILNLVNNFGTRNDVEFLRGIS